MRNGNRNGDIRKHIKPVIVGNMSRLEMATRKVTALETSNRLGDSNGGDYYCVHLLLVCA
jgi:hypothetical protein